MTIRQLTTNDANQYRTLRLQALATNPESYLAHLETEKDKSVDSFAWELRYSAQLPVNGYFGLFEKEQLIGYAQLEQSSLPKQRHIAYLYNLYVDPAFRGKGYASQLLDHLTKLAKDKANVERIFITCNRKNLPAQAFYKKLGFQEYSIRPKSVKWQGEYDDEVEMVKEI
jgi:ribosomal protein S18 acetylase RimI-like enzyme